MRAARWINQHPAIVWTTYLVAVAILVTLFSTIKFDLGIGAKIGLCSGLVLVPLPFLLSAIGIARRDLILQRKRHDFEVTKRYLEKIGEDYIPPNLLPFWYFSKGFNPEKEPPLQRVPIGFKNSSGNVVHKFFMKICVREDDPKGMRLFIPGNFQSSQDNDYESFKSQICLAFGTISVNTQGITIDLSGKGVTSLENRSCAVLREFLRSKKLDQIVLLEE